MPVAVSVKIGLNSCGPAGPSAHSGHPPAAAWIRLPQDLQTRRFSHSGHRFQFTLTGIPHCGQTSPLSGCSQAGQNFQPSFTGSAQAGQADEFWFVVIG
jgi:hypothetical protein